jgi:hypothetical protein
MRGSHMTVICIIRVITMIPSFPHEAIHNKDGSSLTIKVLLLEWYSINTTAQTTVHFKLKINTSTSLASGLFVSESS